MSGILHHIQYIAPQTKMETLTDVTAGLAVVSPWWLPYAKTLSEDLAVFMVPAGLLWFIVQIICKILITRKILRSDGK